MSSPQSYWRYIRWNIDLSGIQEAAELFSAKRRKRLRQSFKALEGTPYHFEIHPVTPADIDAFSPIYRQHIQSIGGQPRPVEEYLQACLDNADNPPYLLGFYENETLLGGLTFRERNVDLSSMYRAFPHTFTLKLSSSISHLAEYLFVEAALERGKRRITHGRDRNGYGLNSAIGLALFKLGLDAVPAISLSEKNEKLTVPSNCDKDALIFIGDKPGSPCTEAILYTDTPNPEETEQYRPLFTQKIVPVRILPRPHQS